MNNRTNWILLAIVGLLAVIAFAQGGFPLVLNGFESGVGTLVDVIPLLIAAFLIAGLAQVLITPELVNRWLGSSAGWKGIALACIGGAVLPGGPYVYYPIAAILLKAGASLGVLIAFVTAKNLYSLARLPLEMALLTPRLALIRFGLTLIMPPLFGLIAQTFFGSYVDRIRENVPV